MKTVVLLYNSCCIYEIVILNYFLNYSKKEVSFVSIDGESITSMEGYSINVSAKLSDISTDNVALFVVPGGKITETEPIPDSRQTFYGALLLTQCKHTAKSSKHCPCMIKRRQSGNQQQTKQQRRGFIFPRCRLANFLPYCL